MNTIRTPRGKYALSLACGLGLMFSQASALAVLKQEPPPRPKIRYEQ